MNNGGMMRAVLKNITNNWRIWKDGPKINSGEFGVFLAQLSAYILSMCVPSPLFLINQPLFL